MTTIYPEEENILNRLEQSGGIYVFTHPKHREDLDLPTLRALVRLMALGDVTSSFHNLGAENERQYFRLTAGGYTRLERKRESDGYTG